MKKEDILKSVIDLEFNVGQDVFFIQDNKVWCQKISALEVRISMTEIKVNYTISSITRNKIYATKEELLKSL